MRVGKFSWGQVGVVGFIVSFPFSFSPLWDPLVYPHYIPVGFPWVFLFDEYISCFYSLKKKWETYFSEAYNIFMRQFAYQLPPVHLPMLKLLTRTPPTTSIIRIREAPINIHRLLRILIIHDLILLQCRQGSTIKRLTKAKIWELHVTIFVQKKIVRFDIPVKEGLVNPTGWLSPPNDK